MSEGPYSRIYWSIVDHPRFEKVYNDDYALALWVRLLVLADSMWPASAPIPALPRSRGTPNRALTVLIECGLVVPSEDRRRYTIRGMNAERERRSQLGRNAALARYAPRNAERNANGNAPAMPRRDETSKDEQGAPQTFLRFPPKKEPGMLADQYRHEGQHPNCDVCAAVKT